MLKKMMKKISSGITAVFMTFSVVSAFPVAVIHADDEIPAEMTTETTNSTSDEAVNEVDLQSEEVDIPVVTEEEPATEEETPVITKIPEETPVVEETPSEPQEPTTEETPVISEENTEETTVEEFAEENDESVTDEIATQEAEGDVAVQAVENVVSINETGYASVTEAVAAVKDGETITFLKDVNESVTVSSKTVTFDLNGKAFSGSGASTLTVKKANVIVNNGTLTSASGYRSITATDSTVTANNVNMVGSGDISSESVKDRGGISYAANTDFTMTGGNVTNGAIGSGSTYGGGLFFENTVSNTTTTINVDGTTFSGNAAMYGGGISYFTKDNTKTGRTVNITVKNSIFENNSGTALFLDHGNLKTEVVFNATIDNNTFTNNTSTKYGGAISVNYTGSNKGLSTLNLSGNTFTNNSTTGIYAGALFIGVNVNTTLNNNIFTSNIAASRGGAIALYGRDDAMRKLMNNGSFSSTGNTFTSNTCKGDTSTGGGAIYAEGYNVTLNSDTFDSNKTDIGYGGAIFYMQNRLTTSTGKVLTDNGSIYINNNAKSGGAISNYSTGVRNILAEINLNGTTFSNNIAQDKGGALFANLASVINLNNSQITKNTANGDGVASGKYDGTGGGFYVLAYGGEGLDVNINGSSRIYNNYTPNEATKILTRVSNGNELVGISSDISCRDVTYYSSNGAVLKTEPVRLNFESEDNKTVNVDGDTSYNLTQYDDQKVKENSTKFNTYHSYYTKQTVKPRIYLSATGNLGHDIRETDIVVNTIDDAINKAIENNVDKVYVCDTIKLDKDYSLNTDLKFVRCENNTVAMFEIGTGTTLTINKAIIDGNGVKATRSMIEANAPGSSIVIAPVENNNGNVVFENGYTFNTDSNGKNSGTGGAISLDANTGHAFTMYGGTFRNNYAYEGGSVYLFNTNATVYGGIFENNSAYEYGGALMAHNSQLNIKALENIAPVSFNSNEVQYYGGALYLETGTDALIEAGSFTNNRSTTDYTNIAYYAGGAIYNNKGAKLTIKNAEIANNFKQTNSEGSSSAQISNCPTGQIAIYQDQGSLIYNNSQTFDDVAFSNSGNIMSKLHYATVSDYAMGGGNYNWTPEADYSQNIYQNVPYNKTFRIKSHLTEESINNGKAYAKVFINNNSAYLAATAIGNNGILILGSEQQELEVSKEWKDDADNHSTDSVTVQLAKKYTNGTIELVSTDFRKDAIKVLNASNNWTGYWMDLGTDYNEVSNQDFVWTVVEAGKTGYVSSVSDPVKVEPTDTEQHRYKVVIENEPNGDYNDLVITKNIVGDDEAKKTTFPFEVKVKVSGLLYTYQINGGEQQIVYPDQYGYITVSASLSNDNTITINGLERGSTYTITETSDVNYKVTVNGNEVEKDQDGCAIVEGTLAGQTENVNYSNIQLTTISGTKTWDDANDQDGLRPDSITVKLLAGGNEVANQTVTAENDWKYEFTDLPKYNEGKEIKYTVSEDAVEGYEATIDGFNITNTHIPATTSVTVNKTWKDADNQDGIRPESITVNLFANGKQVKADDQDVTATLNDENHWTYTFADLPKKEAGKEIVYSVKEIKVEGYTTRYTRNVAVNEDGNTVINITNSHKPEQTSVSVEKIWDDADNQDGIRTKRVYISLYANKEKVEETEIVATDGWKHVFENLPKFSNGEKIEYTVTESEVNGYDTTITGDAEKGFTITNTHTPATTSVTVEKIWDDANNQDGIRAKRVYVDLYANGDKVAETEIVATDDWKHVFEDLPKFSEGKEIKYTVKEADVPGYDAKIKKLKETPNSFTITNTHIPATMSVTVEKIWNDADNQDGIRTKRVYVNLYANGDKVARTEIVATDDWKHTFNNLPKYSEGKEITYTVDEEEVAGYVTEISEEKDQEKEVVSKYFTIKNTHTPEMIAVEGKKDWSDNDNQDGLRPESITVRLLADGNEVANQTVTNENDWHYEFTDLPKYSGGKEITYTVSEDAVEGYEATIDGFDITNTHELETVNVSGEKVWDDADNQDGVRPESIIVHLYANGEEERTQTVTAENNWKFSFENLYKYRNGNPIRYSVVEEYVEGYEIGTVTGNAEDGFVITNKRTPEMINRISGTKTWDDNNNQDGKRPESITVRLLADGTEVANQTVTASNDWNYEFTNLPKFSNGKEITYTVAEDDVDGYTAIVEGYNITNTHTPETVRINGQKVWNDNNNAGNTRPESITVQLYANGVQVAETTANKDLDWFFTFGELPVYANGEKITYTVTETPVEGYRSSVSGNELTGFTVRNTLRPQTPETNDKEEPTIKPATPTTIKRRPQTPFTADTNNVALYGGLTFVALATVLGILIRKRES